MVWCVHGMFGSLAAPQASHMPLAIIVDDRVEVRLQWDGLIHMWGPCSAVLDEGWRCGLVHALQFGWMGSMPHMD